MARKIGVEIVGDERDLLRAFKNSSRGAREFNRDISRSSRATRSASLQFVGFGKAALGASGILLGTSGVVQGLQQSVVAASNLAEQTSKSREVFKKSSRDIEAWAKTTAEGFGIANDQALEAAGTFGNLFRTVGLAPRDAAQMSRTLTELAADLASFNNANPAEALDALRSGLIGEAEPLRRFGVLLSESRVQQDALAVTGKTNARALTDQEKAMARYRIILGDTKTAQGDFARTSDSFANKTRVLEAELRDLSATLGKVVVPALTVLVDSLNKVLHPIETTKKALKDLRESVPEPPADKGGLFGGLFDFDLPSIGGIDEMFRRIRGVQDAAKTPVKVKVEVSQGLAAIGRIEERLAELRNPTRTVFTAEQRRQFFDASVARQLDKVQDQALKEQVASLKRIAARISQRIALTKDITRRLNLEDDLRDVNRQRKGVEAQIADNAAAARQLALDKQRERIEKARAAAAEARAKNTERLAKAAERRATRQFAALGFGPGGGELVPTRDRLRKQLGTVSEAVKGTFLDTDKTRSLFATMRKIISEALVPPEVRSKMRDLLRDISQQLNEQAKGPLTKFHKENANRILAGLGLSPDQTRALRARLSQVGVGGTVPGSGQGAFGLAVPDTVVHTEVKLNQRVIATAVTRSQQKRRRRNPPQKRGPGLAQAQ